MKRFSNASVPKARLWKALGDALPIPRISWRFGFPQYPVPMDATVFLTPLYSTIAVVVVFMLVGLLLGWVGRLVDSLLSSVLGGVVYNAWGTIFVPGVMMHELSHALFLSLTGACVSEIVVREDSRRPWTLYRARGVAPANRYASAAAGHVSYRRRGPYLLQCIQRVAGASAPTFVGLTCIVVLVQALMHDCTQWWHYALCIYLLICAINGATMSTVDIRDMAPGLPVCLVIIYAAFLLTGFDAFAMFSGWFGIATTKVASALPGLSLPVNLGGYL